MKKESYKDSIKSGGLVLKSMNLKHISVKEKSKNFDSSFIQYKGWDKKYHYAVFFDKFILSVKNVNYDDNPIFEMRRSIRFIDPEGKKRKMTVKDGLFLIYNEHNKEPIERTRHFFYISDDESAYRCRIMK